MSAISSIPSSPMSSSRPMKGLMNVAPALAASSACAAVKHSVTLTMWPSSESALQALSPSQVSGTLTAMLGAISARCLPSRIMPSASAATTSALTGPSTSSQISRVTSAMSRPDLRISEGLVVTPSTMPSSCSSRMAAMSAVSTKNLMSWLLRGVSRNGGMLGRGCIAEHPPAKGRGRG